jgi:hypothetical protein
MRVRFVVALLAAAAMTPMAAQAQNHTTENAASGAAAGAAVGGPVGAAVGAAVGGTVGAAGDVARAVLAPPPPPVITYVEREEIPSVTIEEEIVVGRPLPPAVELRVVPTHRKYAYAVVNHQRVIVDPRTRTVIQVIR